jgi:hypothetical protein
MMLKPILAFALSAALVSPAFASETADACRTYVEENGGDASGCDCLGAAADKDADLAAAIAEISTPADLEAAGDATKAAIAACFPDAG